MRYFRMLAVPCVALMAACSHSAPVHATAARVVAVDAPARPVRTPAPIAVETCGEARVHFATGSADLDGQAQARLDAYARCVARGHRHTLYIAGTTDPRGTEMHNMTLAQQRARAVADYLHASGCPGDFEVRSYGEAEAEPSPDSWPAERTATVSLVPPVRVQPAVYVP